MSQLIVVHDQDPARNETGVSPGARQDVLLIMLAPQSPGLMPLLYALSLNSKRFTEKIQPSNWDICCHSPSESLAAIQARVAGMWLCVQNVESAGSTEMASRGESSGEVIAC
jgi:hypothetical protein